MLPSDVSALSEARFHEYVKVGSVLPTIRQVAPINEYKRVYRLLSQFNLASSEHARTNLLLRRRVDEDVKRRQLTVLRYTNVSASHPLRVIGRSIGPRKATDAV